MIISQKNIKNTINRKGLSQILIEHIMPDCLMIWGIGLLIVSGKLYEYVYNTVYYILSHFNNGLIIRTKFFTEKILIIVAILMFLDAIRVGVNVMYVLFPPFPSFCYKKYRPRLARKVFKEYEEQ